MPARTLPTSFIRSPTAMHRDYQNERRSQSDTNPDMPFTRYVDHHAHNPYASFDRTYPNPHQIPPPLVHLQHSVPQFRNGHMFMPTVAPVQHAYPRAGTSNIWHQPPNLHIHAHPQLVNVPYLSPLPPSIAHKVWILDCKACGTFFTNRGMKAVLLLRPNVPLYSTDALPINCSAYSADAETSSPSISTDTSVSSQSSPSERQVRACECLTQTLCCHKCGNAVGYMIVIPCSRCTSSITATNRTTNGHRFVFYSGEISASERHYVPGEPGVEPFHPLSPTAHVHMHHYHQLSGGMSSPAGPYHTHGLASSYTPGFMALGNVPARSPHEENSMFAFEAPPDVFRDLTSSANSLTTSGDSPPLSSDSIHSHHSSISTTSSMPALVDPSPSDAHSQDRQPLKAGEVLFWHHLVRSGEIPGAVENPRARATDLQAITKIDMEAKCLKGSSVIASRPRKGRKIIAGR